MVQSESQTFELLAEAIAKEPAESLKVAIVDDNREAGILKSLLTRCKGISKKRIAHLDYYTISAQPMPKGCDIAIVSMVVRPLCKFQVVPPVSCKQVVVLQKTGGEIKFARLDMHDRGEGTPISLRLK